MDVLRARLRALGRRARVAADLFRGRPLRSAPTGRLDLRGLAGPLEEGVLDGVTAGVAHGWARRVGAPDRPVEVDIYVDGGFIGRTSADRLRPDLVHVQGGRGRSGFAFVLPLSARAGRVISAFAAPSGIELSGSPSPLTTAVPPPALAAKDRRALAKLDFHPLGLLTIADQKRAYGRRHSILVETDPAYPDGAWPVSRCMGYVDARYAGGASPVSGAEAFFALFDLAAERFAAAPYGMPVGEDLAAMLTGVAPGAPTRLAELLATYGPAPPSPLAQGLADHAGLVLDYLYARRLPLDLMGDRLLSALQNRQQRLTALRRVSCLREAAGSDAALLAAADAMGLDAALRSGEPREGVEETAEVESGVRVFSADYGDSGLAVNTRRTLDALRQAGIAHDRVESPMQALPSTTPLADGVRATAIIHAQPPDAVELILRLGPQQSSQRLIGFYMWETERAPADFSLGLRLVDEIWTGSRYSAEALAADAGAVPVHVVGHAVRTASADAAFDARALAGAAKAFLVYTHFDAGSWITRKNPGAVVRAFQSAFSGEEAVRLVIKTRGSARDLSAPVRTAWAELMELIEADRRICLIDRDLAPGASAALMGAADCYVSLHRSEGFGYGLAEAMLAGVPLVASAYGGSLDFTEEAWLVPCRRRAIRPGEFVAYGEGQFWGEPDVAVAAAHLRAIHKDTAAAKAMASSAQARLEKRLSIDALAERYSARLAEG